MNTTLVSFTQHWYLILKHWLPLKFNIDYKTLLLKHRIILHALHVGCYSLPISVRDSDKVSEFKSILKEGEESDQVKN